jgi:hypothetical protein
VAWRRCTAVGKVDGRVAVAALFGHGPRRAKPGQGPFTELLFLAAALFGNSAMSRAHVVRNQARALSPSYCFSPSFLKWNGRDTAGPCCRTCTGKLHMQDVIVGRESGVADLICALVAMVTAYAGPMPDGFLTSTTDTTMITYQKRTVDPLTHVATVANETRPPCLDLEGEQWEGEGGRGTSCSQDDNEPQEGTGGSHPPCRVHLVDDVHRRAPRRALRTCPALVVLSLEHPEPRLEHPEPRISPTALQEPPPGGRGSARSAARHHHLQAGAPRAQQASTCTRIKGLLCFRSTEIYPGYVQCNRSRPNAFTLPPSSPPSPLFPPFPPFPP